MKQIMKGLTESRTPQGACILRVHYSCDPDREPSLHPEWKAEERKKYTSQGAWDREQEIVFSAGGGERIFAETLIRWADKIFIDPVRSGFAPDPDWKTIAGFDWGKANPTAAIVAKVDFEGTIYIMNEYYQPNLSPKQHVPNLHLLNGFEGSAAYADPTIFYQTQAQSDGTFKALSAMFAEDGISNLYPAPERNELVGMERILAHWMNLDEREPTLRIVCPEEKRDIPKPSFGVHNEGCPNLVWELRRTRRAELSATQLQSKNPTEKIVDKENHLRDCLKYIVLSLPSPTVVPIERKLKEIMQQAPDPTSAMLTRAKFEEEQRQKNAPIFVGRSAKMKQQLFRNRMRNR